MVPPAGCNAPRGDYGRMWGPRRILGVSVLSLAVAMLCAQSAPGASAHRRKAQPSAFKQFAIPAAAVHSGTAKNHPGGLAVGPEGNIWFTEVAGNEIGRVTPKGSFRLFPIPTPGSLPGAITVGPDHDLWFTQAGSNEIGRITPSGTISEFPIPSAVPRSGISSITAGPDGNLWFGESVANKIGRITTSGQVSQFSIPTPSSFPDGIAAGQDGNIWFTEGRGEKIGQITPSGTITEFPIHRTGFPARITAGLGGDLWFTVTNRIGRITPSGTISEFPLPARKGERTEASGIALGREGDLWFVEELTNRVSRITPSGRFGAAYSVPPAESFPSAITADPSGNLWITGLNANEIVQANTRLLTKGAH
jgi:streptogramin lyase